MKQPLFLLLLFLFSQGTTRAQQIGSESFSYEVKRSHVYMYLMDEKDEKLKTPVSKILAKEFLFDKVGEFEVEDAISNIKTTYYKLELVPFSQKFEISEEEAIEMCNKGELRKSNERYACNAFIKMDNDYVKNSKNNTEFQYYTNASKNNLSKVVKNDKDYIINRSYSDSLFAIESGSFDKHITNKEIVRRYWKKGRIAYGPSFSVPFKFRSEVNDEPLRIDPSFQLGGFIGLKWRIHKYSPVYILPMATLGVTNISINESTIGSGESIPDGQILARTLSLGVVAQIDKFQIGVVLGWDKPGGEIGKDWVYSDRPWYSFQIGFDFLNLNSEVTEK